MLIGPRTFGKVGFRYTGGEVTRYTLLPEPVHKRGKENGKRRCIRLQTQGARLC